MKTLKVEEVYLAGYYTFADVVSRLRTFIDQVYNARRLHSSLDYVYPTGLRNCTLSKRLSLQVRTGPASGVQSTKWLRFRMRLTIRHL
jgi:hypothetical protein